MKLRYLFALLAGAAPLGAQSIPVADSLLRIGSLARAESLYYAAARTRPHDPIARWALGRYLVARGATRVGATLLEEALKFGGEPAIVGRDLAPVYLAIGDYKSLAALSVASPAERARARWLAAHESRVVAPESTLVAVYWPSVDGTTLGRIPIRINGRTVEAAVSTRIQGILIAGTATAARGLHRFDGTRGRSTPPIVLAAADSVSIGRMSLINYPVAVGTPDDKQVAMIGLDVLSHFAPTFDPKGNRVTLRLSETLAPAPLGEHFATLATGSDVRVVQAGGWLSLLQPQIAHMLRDRRWTLDGKHGQLVVEP